jgi:hypothetical protein
MDHSDHEPSKPSPGWLLPMKISFTVILGIAAFFIISEHWVHLAGILPWFLILSCPLMHLFMHGGHGGHNDDNTKDDNYSNSRTH